MVRIIKDGTVRRLRVRGRDAVAVRGGPGAAQQAAFWAVRIGARIASAGEIDCASSSTREVVAHAWRRLCRFDATRSGREMQRLPERTETRRGVPREQHAAWIEQRNGTPPHPHAQTHKSRH